MRQNHHVKRVAATEVRAECAERRATKAEAETGRLLVLLALERAKCAEKDAEIANLNHRVEQMQETSPSQPEVPFANVPFFCV